MKILGEDKNQRLKICIYLMNHTTVVFFVIIIFWGMIGCESDWSLKEVPLTAKWAKEVSPKHVLPEYPRPQLVREKWLHLNGLWDYTITDINALMPKKYHGKILVPFPVESALSGVNKILDKNSRIWYRRFFEIPDHWQGHRIILHFQASNWMTTVWINGHKINIHWGGFDSFSYEIAGFLNRGGIQEIVVGVSNPIDDSFQNDATQNRLAGISNQQKNSGIWQTIWVEPLPAEASIDKIQLNPDIDNSEITVKIGGFGLSSKYETEVTILSGQEMIAVKKGLSTELLSVPIQEPKLWSPQHPFLYDLKIILRSGDKIIDEISSYFGMRKISVEKAKNDITQIQLNNRFLFLNGVLDQGLWPEGLYTAPTDKALYFDVKKAKDLGFNLIRKSHIGSSRWYYWCDTLGMLVWQDLPYITGETQPEVRLDESAQLFYEYVNIIFDLYNNPSIVTWNLVDNGKNLDKIGKYTDLIKKVDPSRLVGYLGNRNLANDSEQWELLKNIKLDMIDVNIILNRSEEIENFLKFNKNSAFVVGEYGSLNFGIPKFSGSSDSNEKGSIQSLEEFTEKYLSEFNFNLNQAENAGICAMIYKQLYDTEDDFSGLLSYDRKVLKVDSVKINRAILNSKILQ